MMPSDNAVRCISAQGLVHVIPAKKTPTQCVGVSRKGKKARLMDVKHVKTAAGNHWRNRPTTETEVGVSREHRISHDVRHVIVRINRLWREVIGGYRVVGREGRGDHFIDADSGARKRTIDATNETGGVRRVWRIKHCGLFHGAPEFAATDNFIGVVHAATELLLDVSAAGEKRGGNH